jgi:chromosome partitioning protein
MASGTSRAIRRIAYRKAARDGLSVEELKPADPKAGEEMRTLFREVFDGE